MAEEVAVGCGIAVDSGPTDVLFSRQNSTSRDGRTELLRICYIESIVVLS